MPLNKAALKTNIVDLLKDLRNLQGTNPEISSDQIIDNFATGLADHIETYVKSGDINILVGEIPVQVSLPSGSGANTTILKKQLE